MVRFVHTSDWQLGMTRHYLDGRAQGRFADARFEAVRAVGRLAVEQGCEFVVVAGDVFESNQVERRTVSNTLDALGGFTVPVWLLPGNHDALDPASVYRSPTFTQRKPDHVQVLHDRTAREIRPGVELVGAPWTSKQPLEDLVARATAELGPKAGVTRVLVAHGMVDELSPDRTDPGLIRLADAERALADGRIHFLALGDRHSTTAVGSSERIWYSGSPETTGYRDVQPRQALVVELDGDRVEVTPHQVGQWHFQVLEQELAGAADVDLVATELEQIPNKTQTVIKLKLRGALTLRLWERLEQLLELQRDVFAAIEQPLRHRDVAIVPDENDFDDLDLKGFAARTLEELRARADGGSDDAETARDALGLLRRLAGRVT